MKKSTIVILAIIIAAIIIILTNKKKTVAPVVEHTPSTQADRQADRRAPNGGTSEPAPGTANTEAARITGTVSEVDTGCFSDGLCRIKVDGTWVITTQGWYQGPQGTANSTYDIGTKVEVYGKKIPEGITMIGDSSYYVKVVK